MQNFQYPPPPPPQAYPPPPPPKKSPNTCLIVGISLLIGVLCLGVVGVGGYFLYQRAGSSVAINLPSFTNPTRPPSAAPTAAAPDVSPTPVANTGVDCPGAPKPSRLHKGGRASVGDEMGSDPLIIFDKPVTQTNDAKNIGEVLRGEQLLLIDGPVCTESVYWWLVEFGDSGQRGWAPEGSRRGTYWLEPVP